MLNHSGHSERTVHSEHSNVMRQTDIYKVTFIDTSSIFLVQPPKANDMSVYLFYTIIYTHKKVMSFLSIYQSVKFVFFLKIKFCNYLAPLKVLTQG